MSEPQLMNVNGLTAHANQIQLKSFVKRVQIFSLNDFQLNEKSINSVPSLFWAKRDMTSVCVGKVCVCVWEGGGSGCVCMYMRVRQRQVGLRQEPNNSLKLPHK